MSVIEIIEIIKIVEFQSIVIFAITQLINVILSTIKSIATVKAPIVHATLINIISYTLNAIITYYIARQTFLVVLIFTPLTNAIGVPLGRYISDRFEKDKLFIYNATIKCSAEIAENIYNELKHSAGIATKYFDIVEDKIYDFAIHAETKEESKVITALLDSYKAKYYVIEPR